MPLSFFHRKKEVSPASKVREPADRPEFPPPPYMLNLGCGACYDLRWLNLDFVPQAKEVHQHDLREALPFASETATVIYHSHLLEHFTRAAARKFLAECFRVLKPGGILRVVVPDLEMITRTYLQNLEAAAKGDSKAAVRHEWMTLELVDQLAREESGGEMLKFWRQNPMPEETFVIERLGREVLRFLEYFRSLSPEEQEMARKCPDPPGDPTRIGLFRLGGEPHKWMYDRVSLKRLLEEAGFHKVEQRPANQSDIPDFGSYRLDLHTDGTVRKPDSLFMEGRKPATL